MNVLIVDDSLVVRKMIENNLKQLGLIVAGTASNGHEALRLFDSLRPDLVTLDITMPEIDGLEVLEGIRKKNTGTPVIIISALKDRDTGVKALKMGARAFLLKPFTPQQLEEEIKLIKEGNS